MEHMALSLWCIELFALVQAYVNVAQNKPAYQEYQWMLDVTRSDASNGVDGRKSDLSYGGAQCVISADEKQTATWWVNLTSTHSIHHIVIYYRTENRQWGRDNYYTSRFLGFSVYVSNTTDRLQGTLCFKDDNFTLDTIPAVFNTTCPVHGQYVIFYDERLPGVIYPSSYSQYAFNDICELEVYGCPAIGCYGSNNTLPCPDVYCQYCHRETGTCQRCKSGYKGSRCEIVCDRESYGYDCKETCGYCRNVDQCSNINGTCLTGCDAGYNGNLCKTPCDRGLYGSECNETCGHCREIDQCSNINGTCLTGCDAGYQGGLCKTLCDRESYGYHCIEACGYCRDVDQCSNINGTCLTGCDAGYNGNLCKTPCTEEYFGVGCTEKCSSTCKGCNNVNGSCDLGCHPGWKGDYCHEESTLAMNEKNWKSEFSGILSAFCISLIFNAITIAYFVLKRIRDSTTEAKQLRIHQTNVSKTARKSDVFNVYTNETNTNYYQELGEYNKAETYEISTAID